MQTRWIVISEHDANIPAKPHYRSKRPEGATELKPVCSAAELRESSHQQNHQPPKWGDGFPRSQLL